MPREIVMVFLDSNVFIIDRFFPRDQNYPVNRQFLSSLKEAQIKGALPYYTLLEICGVASFNLNEEELEKWLYLFGEIYPVEVLDPYSLTSGQKVDLGNFLSDLSRFITKKMTIGDAVFLREAEMYRASAIVTWNKKHFVGRTSIKVYTPAEFQVDQH